MPEKRISGFTLMEVLVATSIFAVVVVSIYSAFHTGMQAYRKVDASFGIYQTARLVFARIESDLRNSFVYTEDDSRFTGTADSFNLLSVLPSYDNSGKASLNICRVKYAMQDGGFARSLFKGLEAFKEGPKDEPQTLSSSIKAVSFEYAFSKREFSETYEWQDSWPKRDEEEQKKSLPLAVKIKLSIEEAAQKADSKTKARIVEFIRVVSLPQESLVK